MLPCFSNTFEIVNRDAGRIWASKNYHILIDEYIDKPTLPPPLIIISYVFRFIRRIFEKGNKGNRSPFFNFMFQKVVENESNYAISFCLYFLLLLNYFYLETIKQQEEIDQWVTHMSEEFYLQQIFNKKEAFKHPFP